MDAQEISDIKFLRRALVLAKKGLGSTYPNPMVGAVIVKDGKIIGEGFHKKFGLAHAEIEALNNLKDDAVGATLYVNLEPCNHYGKTPPCTEAIIKSGIKRVVLSSLDQNPKVAGQGVQVLEKNGIEVSFGLLEIESQKLNEVFFFSQKNGRPFITLKFASSLDGKIATFSRDSKWITGNKSLKYSHRLRGKNQAVIVGINTVLFDNPNLGSHSRSIPDPLRIILDPKLKIPSDSQVLRDKNILIVTTESADKQKLNEFKSLGFEVLVFSGSVIPLDQLLKVLIEKDITSVLVEGGGNTIGNFVDENFYDKLYGFYAPVIIGGRDAITPVEGKGVELVSLAKRFNIESIKKLGDDFLVTAYPKYEI